jgi:N-acetylglucosamine kinase-like BadF-type ATPase
MASYFLGVDIGNSKSHALIADETGRAIGFSQAGPGSHEQIGWEGLRRVLASITGQALASAGLSKAQLVGVGFGMAGYDWPGQYEPTRQAILSLELGVPFEFVNDALIGLIAGAPAGWGVVIIAGTSNNCYGRDPQGRQGRVTGCGPWAGEYGGATEIVAKAVQSVVMAWTRRGPATHLTERFIELTGASDIVDLLEGLYTKRYRLSAANAPTIFETAATGDRVAQEIVRWAGRELGSLAVGVIRQIDLEDLEFEVVLAGSLYNCNAPALFEELAAAIQAAAPRAYLARLNAPPVVGGVLLGMEQVGLKPAGVRQTLIESTNRLLDSHQ